MGEQRTRCPYCAELILTDAKMCRFCQRWLQEDEPEPPEASSVAGDMAVDTPAEDRKVAVEAPVAKPHAQEARKVAESPTRKAKTKGMKGSFPWLRIILFMAYIALIVGCVMMERNALEQLSDAKAKESQGDTTGALAGYEGIRDRFPFSFSTIEAYEGIRRLVDQGGQIAHKPVKPPVLGEFIGEELEGTAVYWLPLAVWPICAILLSLVFLTRILRIGVAFLSLLLVAVAVAGTAIQSSWYGLYSIPQMAEVSKAAMIVPLTLFGATYGLMGITALMTLTRTRRPRRK